MLTQKEKKTNRIKSYRRFYQNIFHSYVFGRKYEAERNYVINKKHSENKLSFYLAV